MKFIWLSPFLLWKAEPAILQWFPYQVFETEKELEPPSLHDAKESSLTKNNCQTEHKINWVLVL